MTRERCSWNIDDVLDINYQSCCILSGPTCITQLTPQYETLQFLRHIHVTLCIFISLRPHIYIYLSTLPLLPSSSSPFHSLSPPFHSPSSLSFSPSSLSFSLSSLPLSLFPFTLPLLRFTLPLLPSTLPLLPALVLVPYGLTLYSEIWLCKLLIHLIHNVHYIRLI